MAKNLKKLKLQEMLEYTHIQHTKAAIKKNKSNSSLNQWVYVGRKHQTYKIWLYATKEVQ